MKTAVILAARKEHDSPVPYPLMPFEGEECLMDRILSVLEELDFEKILIVCGYRKELFEKYAGPKVKLLFNEDYAYTASMASLAVAREEIEDDFLLLEGDTFYEKSIIRQMAESEHVDCLAITEESGSGDEAFVETYKGVVTKVSKDRHQMSRYDGEMLGLMRISLVTYRKMLEIWDASSNFYLNYEYAFFDATSPLDRPYLYFKNLIWGDVDSEEDFQKLKNYIYPKLRRKENPFDYDNLLATHFFAFII